MAKRKSSAKPQKAKAAKVAKPPKASRKQASQTAGPGHNSKEYKENLEDALTELFGIKEAMDKDMAGWKGDLAASYEKHAKTLNIRQHVLKEEFKRAAAIRKQIEKEKAYDPIEREQREMLRAATSGMSLNGTPMGDWFAGALAAPGGDIDEDGEVGEEDAAETEEHDKPEPEKARRELAIAGGDD